MRVFLNRPFHIGSLELPNRLLQGPLAGFSCAPFRKLYYKFLPPAYCVSEMISAYDVLYKHPITSRYLYRAPEEKKLCYQLAGHDPLIMAEAAARLEDLGADLIDINCGCPKTKIRKKGAGSALLEVPHHLCEIVRAVRGSTRIPLTVKIRIQGNENDMVLARAIEAAGADALIVHGRRWTDDYSYPSDFHHIGKIKQAIQIPVIANGDIADDVSLAQAMEQSGCDAYMIARAGSGKPWLYEHLLSETPTATPSAEIQKECFIEHLQGLAVLENDHQAMLQSKSLVRYYFGHVLSTEQLQRFYTLQRLGEIEQFIDEMP